MIRPEEWRREFSPLEKELDSLSLSAEEWAEEFRGLEEELRGISLQAEAPDNKEQEAEQ